MTPDIMLLLSVVLLVVLTPALLAVFYLRGDFILLSISLRNFRLSLSRRSRPKDRRQIACEERYEFLQDLRKVCKKQLVDSFAKQEHLDVQLHLLRDRAHALKCRLEKKPNNLRMKTKSLEIENGIIHLEAEAKQQQLKATQLQASLAELDLDVHAAYTQLLVSTASYESAVASKNADRLLSKISAQSANRMIEEMEKKVVERETRSIIRLRPPATKLSEADMEMVDRLASQIASVPEMLGSTFNNMIESVGALARAADPSIERSYQRLYKQLKLARKLGEHVAEQEDELESQIAKLICQIGYVQGQADVESGKEQPESANQWLLKKAHFEACSAELTTALKAHRRHNLSIGQQLFRVEGVVRRLHMIKLLLSALPMSMKEEFVQYTTLVNDVYRYLRSSWLRDIKDPAHINTADFAERIAALEYRSQKAYIRIARGESRQLTTRAALRFKESVSAVITALDLERCEQKSELDKWDALMKRALAENQDFLHAVASQRSEQCAGILKTAEQSLEVLSVTISVPDKPK
jgi:hypothetical protein